MSRATKPWTDDEIGYLQENQHLPHKRLADEMGRSIGSIRGALHNLRHGGSLGSQSKAPWTEEEEAVLVEADPLLTAEKLAELLPGRTAEAIKHRRKDLGVKTMTTIGQRPFDVGPRPLIAKTCVLCGLLLAGSWFRFNRASNGWSPRCRSCAVDKARESQESRLDQEAVRTRGREYYDKAQAITLERATRNGEPYTEGDCEVLADKTLTDLQKALRLGRSYGATRAARQNRGFKSLQEGLGDPERDVWVIDNPNAPEVAA